jgi:hypothetical protein
MKHLKMLLAAGLVIGLVSSAGADIIAQYDFGSDTSPSFASADAHAGTTASALDDTTLDAPDTGIITSTDSKIGSENAASVGVEFPVFKARRDNFDENSYGPGYFGFSITANEDVPDWDQLTFDFYRSGANEFSFRLLSSLTDVDEDFEQVGDDTPYGPTDLNTWVEGAPIDLSSLPALSDGETRYFRLQGAYTGGGGLNTRWLGLDNIELSVVPEPATMSLLALGGLGVLIRRRRS